MEEKGILDPLDQFHIAAVHYIYMAKVNENFSKHAWANHQMRTIKGSPLKLRVSGWTSHSGRRFDILWG